MGAQDYYRGTFALWVGYIQVTKLSGSNHIVESLGLVGVAKLTAIHYWRCGHVCQSASKAARRLNESL